MNEYANLRRNFYDQNNRFIALLRVRNVPNTAAAGLALRQLFCEDFYEELGEIVRFDICEKAKVEHDEYEPTTIAFVQYKYARSHYFALKRFHNMKLNDEYLTVECAGETNHEYSLTPVYHRNYQAHIIRDVNYLHSRPRNTLIDRRPAQNHRHANRKYRDRNGDSNKPRANQYSNSNGHDRDTTLN